ncbi:hypothetical protein [Peribacillus asahii]|uniref:hypothetical protein n=1 Tax=Peribacillus asahii TaxID=228899 RepID=UPI00207A8051|nr:hypothetical protein [Peribacillus asahii]USK72647.1 hypothetical protein LIS76_23260 [Peribacillus asahii]USK72686.1 hypothetical protein LIS76_23845 [Peribacillus asahii]
MRKRRMNYAVYKGEELVFMGKTEECAKFLGVKPKSVWQKAWRTHENKHKSKYNIVAIEVDE